MPHVEAIRSQVQKLLNAVPFRPFILTMDSGQQVVVGHPENIAFVPDSPEEEGSEDFYVASGKLRLISTFSKVSDISLATNRSSLTG
jgi:hypothetical protein